MYHLLGQLYSASVFPILVHSFSLLLNPKAVTMELSLVVRSPSVLLSNSFNSPDFHCHCLYLGFLSHNLLLRLTEILHFAFLTPAMFAHRLSLLNSLDEPCTAQVLLGMQF